LFPAEGHAWVTRDELVAGFDWARRFDCADCFTVEEWDEFIPGNDEKPYTFVTELFEMRRAAKSKEEYDIVELAIKLVLNSLYGKTVQSVNGDEDNPPSCACPYYGAAITGNCRARLVKAALLDPYAVVCFMTDGIVTTRPLVGEPYTYEWISPEGKKEIREGRRGLSNAKEVFNGKPPEGVEMDLGDWEFEEMAGGFFLQSGVYCLIHKNGETKDKTRGADPRNFILKMPLKELMLDKVLPEWRGLPDPKKPSRYNLDIEIKNYVTAGSAAASDERFKLIGRWSETTRTIDIHNLGTKRGLISKFPEFYFSGPPVKGVIKREMIEQTADVLGVPFKEVAECYRSGEALRCRFLVPSMPTKNGTPDDLSLPGYPEWLDPDYEEDDNEGSPWNLTDQDRDTGDILVGAG
jgi:hypothetical protein